MSRQPPIARPPGNLGTSGQHFVPPVSPSLDPAIFGEVEPRDTVRMLGVKAMAVVRQQALAAQHGSRQIYSDPTIPAPEKHRRADAVATAAIMPALEPLEKARRTFEKSISELHAMLAGPAVELSDVRGIEIRSMLAGLPADKRFAAISRAVARGDNSIVAAVLGSDRLLTDFLSDLEVERICDHWAKTRHPDEVALLAQRELDLGHVERAGKILISYQRECAGPNVLPQVAPAGSSVVIRGSGPAPVNRAFAR